MQFYLKKNKIRLKYVYPAWGSMLRSLVSTVIDALPGAHGPDHQQEAQWEGNNCCAVIKKWKKY